MMTEKQANFRSDLITRALQSKLSWYKNYRVGQRETAIVEAAFIISLPEPQDNREVSAQINALKSGIMVYAKANQAWAQPILNKLIAHYGDNPQQWPDAPKHTIYGTGVGTGEKIAMGEDWTVESLTDMAKAALAV